MLKKCSSGGAAAGALALVLIASCSLRSLDSLDSNAGRGNGEGAASFGGAGAGGQHAGGAGSEAGGGSWAANGGASFSGSAGADATDEPEAAAGTGGASAQGGTPHEPGEPRSGGDAAGSGGASHPDPSSSGAAGAGGSPSDRCEAFVYPEPEPHLLAKCPPSFAACLFLATTPEAINECRRNQNQECRDCHTAAGLRCSTQQGCAGLAGTLECCLGAEDGGCLQEASAVLECAAATIEQGACPRVAPACTCSGSASSEGEVAGGPLPVRFSYAWKDEAATALLFANEPYETGPSGQLGMLLHLQLEEGVESYVASPCRVIRRTPVGADTVADVTCTVELAGPIQFASVNRTCDGRIQGKVSVSEEGAASFEVTFDTPLVIAKPG